MGKVVHLILNKKSNHSDQILILEHGYPELVWDHSLDLTPIEALTEVKRIYLHHIERGNQVLVSTCHEYRRKQDGNELRPLDVMDDDAMIVEALSR
jgi:hypothetical protein